MHKTYVWYETLGHLARAYIVVANSEKEARKIMRNNMRDFDDDIGTNEFIELKVLERGDFLFVD